jgi:hypothetical protein
LGAFEESYLFAFMHLKSELFLKASLGSSNDLVVFIEADDPKEVFEYKLANFRKLL